MSRERRLTTWPCLEQPGGCACRCHAIRASRPSTKRRVLRWTPERDDRLRSLLASGKRMHEIVAALGVGSNAVRHRMSDLGLSIRTGWRSDFEVQKALGVSWRFTRRWREQGLLVYRAHNSTTWHRISDADLETFVSQHAGVLFDPEKVRDPHLKQIAEVGAAVNRRRVAS